MLKQLVIRIALGAVLAFAASRPARAKKFTLSELVEMARKGNPGIMAGAAATSAMQSQVSEARRNWLPSETAVVRRAGAGDAVSGSRPERDSCQ